MLFSCYLTDHDRPLNKSGRADAAKLGEKLEQLGWIPQLILSRRVMPSKI